MFAQRSSGAFVCLRCQLSLARQQSQRPAFQTLRTAAPSCTAATAFSTRTRLRQEPAVKPDERDHPPGFGPDVNPPTFVPEDTGDVNVHDIVTPAAAEEAKDAGEDAVEDATIGPLTFGSLEPSPQRLSKRPLNIRGRKGKAQRLSSEPLKSQSLGAPSEVIVLRESITSDAEPRWSSAQYEELTPERRKMLQNTIEASLADHRASAGQEDVDNSINKIRPVSMEGPGYPVFLPRKEFNKRRKELDKSFTKPQLNLYCKIMDDQARLDKLRAFGPKLDLPQPEVKKNKSLLSRSKWIEGIRPVTERFPLPEDKDKIIKITKRRLLDKIMLDIWDVGIVEENEATGQMEMKLRPWQLLLLIAQRRNEDTRTLDRISLARNVRFEIFASIDIIRVTANRPSCEQALADVEAVLQDTERLAFNVVPFKTVTEAQGHEKELEVFRRKDIADAARLSGTVIQSNSNSELLIRGRNKVETEDARRILLAIIQPPTRGVNKVVFGRDGPGFISEQGLDDGLPFKYQQRPYGRLTMPVPREKSKIMQPFGKPTLGGEESEKAVEPDSTEGSTAKNEVPEESVESNAVEDNVTEESAEPDSAKFEGGELLESGVSEDYESQIVEHLLPIATIVPEKRAYTAEVEPYLLKKSYWNSNTEAEIQATFGKLLHRYDSESTLLPQSVSALAAAQNAQPDRTLAHNIPGFSAFLRHMVWENRRKPFNKAMQGQADDNFIFRFVASPWFARRGAAAISDFPEMSLHVHIPQDGPPRMAGLYLTVEERKVDVLLPTKPVDARFSVRQLLYAPGALENVRIRDFVKSIETSIEGAGQIRAPPMLSMRIPNWTVRNVDEYKNYRHYRLPNGDRELEMVYFYAGVEHIQPIRFPTEEPDINVNYNAVEGGIAGGRRGELSLRLDRDLTPPTAELETAEDYLGRLVSRGLGIADALDGISNSEFTQGQFSLVRNWVRGSDRPWQERIKRESGMNIVPLRRVEGQRRRITEPRPGVRRVSLSGQDDADSAEVAAGGEREPDAFDLAGQEERGGKPVARESQAAGGEREPDAFDLAGQEERGGKPVAQESQAAGGERELDALDMAGQEERRGDSITHEAQTAAGGEPELDAFDMAGQEEHGGEAVTHASEPAAEADHVEQESNGAQDEPIARTDMTEEEASEAVEAALEEDMSTEDASYGNDEDAVADKESRGDVDRVQEDNTGVQDEPIVRTDMTEDEAAKAVEAALEEDVSSEEALSGEEDAVMEEESQGEEGGKDKKGEGEDPFNSDGWLR